MNHRNEMAQLRDAFQNKEQKYLDNIEGLKLETDSLRHEKDETSKNNEDLKAQFDKLRKRHDNLTDKCSDLNKSLDQIGGEFQASKDAFENQIEMLQRERDQLLNVVSLDGDDAKLVLLKQNFSKEIAEIRKETKDYYENLRREYVNNLENSYKNEVEKLRQEKVQLLARIKTLEQDLEMVTKDYKHVSEERLRYLREMEDAKKRKRFNHCCISCTITK